jgi:apolipoprotein N-acyltransferase
MSDTPARPTRAWTVSAIAERLAALSGWRRRGTAFLAGGVATLALPPAGVLPALYLAFPVLVWMLGGARTNRAAFGTGWWFGFGWFTASLYWIGNALLVFSDRHAWLIPFAVLVLPAFLALYTGRAGVIARIGRNPLERALWLAAGWTAGEWLRGVLFTGFPWNLVGYAWMTSDALMQGAAVVGAYGLSLMAVLSAALPAALVMNGRQVRLSAAAIAALVLVLPWVGGAARLASVCASFRPAFRSGRNGGATCASGTWGRISGSASKTAPTGSRISCGRKTRRPFSSRKSRPIGRRWRARRRSAVC